MITGLGSGPGIVVDGGGMSLPYINSGSDTFTGVLRISSSGLQYYDNGHWNGFPTSHASVRLDGSVENLLQWVRTKQAEEFNRENARRNLEEKAKTHPALAKAFGAIKRAEAKRDAEITKAQENFLILEKLIGEEQTTQYQDEKSI